MRNLGKLILAGAVALACVSTAQAQKPAPLPGATLSQASRTTLDGRILRVSHDPKNVISGVVSPDCPYLTWTLRDLLNYARANHPAIFRQATALRRGGATKDATRDFLRMAICVAEGF